MGTSELRRSTVSWTIIRASGLRKVTKLISLNCYAEVSVDDRPIGQTEPVKGNQPQWNAEFELDISDNSIVKIKIFHRSLIPPDIFRGEALIPGSVVFSTASENVERMYDLVKPGSNDVSGRGCVVVSYQHRSPPLGANPSVPKTASDGGSLSSAVTSGPIDSLQEGLVSTEIEKARVSVTKMSSQGAIPETGEIITTVTNTAASDNVTTVLGYLNKLVSLGDVLSEVHPYAKTAWDVLTVAHKIFSLQEERDTHIRQLWSTAADMLSLLKDAQPLIDAQRDKKDTLIPIVSEMMTQIHSCALFLQEYGEKGVLGRTVRDTFNSTSDDKLEHFIHSFKDLKERFAARTVLKTWQGVLRVQDGLHQLSSIHETNKESEDLECLLGERLKDVTWDLGNVCLPNTRQAVLDRIEHWIDDPDGGSLYWLNGVAGAGKSTIANTVANIFRQRGRLAGSFRFSRDASHRNVADYLCGNLAYQLAHFDGRFKRGVLSAIKDGGRSVHIVPIHNQLKRFIVDVLKAAEINEPIIFVIDALDEIESEAGRRKLLRAIAAESRNMPNFAKLLITSRNERDIRNILNTHCISSSIDEAEGITADIRTYVDFRIQHIREANERLHKYPDWPGLDYRDALARRAAGLFIWIEVACNYIDGGDPDVRLHDVVSGECSEGPQVVLDALYLSILRNAGVKSEDVKYVMGSILVLKMPLTREGLDMFLGLGQHTIRNPISLPDGSQVRLVSTDVTIASLGSMLQCRSGDHRNDRIRILHPSLFDFFTTPGRCNDARFAIDIHDQNRILTICCLNAMELLERDICKINDPTKMNSEVYDLDDRLQKYVPEHVRYACQFWTHHLTDVPRDVQVYDRAKNFLFGHLLHWLEVMSLLRFVDAVIPSLTRIRNWFWDPSRSQHDTVNTLLDDAIRFVQQFDVPLRASAAHIYVSGLAFTPATTTLSKIFADQVDSIPKVISGLHPLWSACLAVFQVDTEGFHGLKKNISISPDGSRFLFSRDGRVIQVLDSATGTAICQPLVGHTGHIFSTAFSQDGSWIITHCWVDGTIRVWNARTGDPCGKLFCSTFPSCSSLSRDGTHIAIMSVSSRSRVLQVLDIATGNKIIEDEDNFLWEFFFSPDSSCLLCWMTDKSVRMYELGTKNVLPRDEPRRISSFAFSAVGMKAAYVYDDNTVRLSCERTGATIGTPLLHKFFVQRILFSPDGNRVVTSADNLQLWDATTGAAIGEPRARPTEGWCSDPMIFSRNGNRFYSLPSENTIEIWDTETGRAVGRPLVFRSKIHIVALSPDGTQVVVVLMGLGDTIIQVWGVMNAERISPYIRGHIHPLLGVAWSSDGGQIISWDSYAIRIWDLEIVTRPYNQEDLRMVTAVTSSQMASRVISVTQDRMLQIWDLTKGAALCSPQQSHADDILCSALSPNGKLVVSASADGTIQLWDALEGCALDIRFLAHEGSQTAHDKCITAVAFSPTGDRIASVSLDKTIRIWDTATGVQVGCPLQSYVNRIESIAFVPNANQLLCVSSRSETRLLDIHTGAIKGRPFAWREHGVQSWCTFLPDDKQILFLTEEGMRWHYDVGSGSLNRLQEPDRTSRVSASAFSPNRTHLVSVVEENVIHIVDVATERVEVAYGHSDKILSVQFSPDGSLVASASRDQTIRIWNAMTAVPTAEARELHTLFDDCDIKFAFSSDGSKIISVDSARYTRIWDTASGQTILSLPQTVSCSYSESISFSADGSHIIYKGDRVIRILDATSDALIEEQQQETDALPLTPEDLHAFTIEQEHTKRTRQVSPDGTRIAFASCNYSIHVSDTNTGTVISTLENIEGNAELPTFSPDGSRIACVVGQTVIKVWDAFTGTIVGKPIKLRSGRCPSSILFSPDGSHIFSVFDNDRVRVCDIKAGLFVDHSLTEAEVGQAIFSQDGTRVLSASDGHLRILDSMDGTVISDLEEGYHTSISVAAFSPDAKRLAYVYPTLHNTSSVILSIIYVRDASTGNFVCEPLDGLSDTIKALSFSTDSSRIMSLSEQGYIVIWDTIGYLSPLHSVRPVITFPPQVTLLCQSDYDPTERDGWFRGENGARLFWVPDDERGIWLTAPPGRLIVGRRTGKFTIIDVEPYLTVPQVREAWREGGVRYLSRNTLRHKRPNPQVFGARILAYLSYNELH